ncbi:hypothetical protein T484DRAFT_1964904 [Baffinella frigidus]|nr:hypothetical protein T484DRAFT_1964904 [Cryptophyta sp. CCMP2293]
MRHHISRAALRPVSPTCGTAPPPRARTCDTTLTLGPVPPTCGTYPGKPVFL